MSYIKIKKPNTKKLIDSARDEIRKKGYMNAIEAAIFFHRKYSDYLVTITSANAARLHKNIEQLLEQIPCSDIHSVNYTSKEVEEFRVKTLYYYLPKP